MKWNVGDFTLYIDRDRNHACFQITITEDGYGSTIIVPPEPFYDLISRQEQRYMEAQQNSYQKGVDDAFNIAIKQLTDVQREHNKIKRLGCD